MWLLLNYTRPVDANDRRTIYDDKREFYGLFRSAFMSTISKKNIESGWRKTGLLPFNPNVVLSQIKPSETKSIYK
jgi:hypothetical protein